jgi:hypothetical protein
MCTTVLNSGGCDEVAFFRPEGILRKYWKTVSFGAYNM